MSYVYGDGRRELKVTEIIVLDTYRSGQGNLIMVYHELSLCKINGDEE